MPYFARRLMMKPSKYRTPLYNDVMSWRMFMIRSRNQPKSVQRRAVNHQKQVDWLTHNWRDWS